jgi:TonB-dependent receptor
MKKSRISEKQSPLSGAAAPVFHGVRRPAAAFDGASCRAASQRFPALVARRRVAASESGGKSPHSIKNAARAAIVFIISTFCLHLPAFSQTATITGRVFNAATGQYLKNAEVRAAGGSDIIYTEDGGYYAITVPAGEVTLTAGYASVQSASATIRAAAGAVTTLDFELQPLLYERPAAAAGGEVVMLDRFVVSEERTGQARAIMDRRAAPNAVTTIATDNFGDLTMGAVGEFLKYMPGVTLDYQAGDPSGVRIGGLDPKYTGFSIDGVTLASSADDTRASTMEQMSITGIESIEFAQTLTAGMDAGGAAGSLNMKSKHAFNRRRDELRLQLGLNGYGDDLALGREWFPDDKRRLRAYPGGQIGYAGVFFNRRLGVEFNASHNTTYNCYQWSGVQYSYKNPDPAVNPGLGAGAEPVITSINSIIGPRINTRVAGNLSVDCKLTGHLVFSLRGSRTLNEILFWNLNNYLRGMNSSGIYANGPSPGTDLAESTLTHLVVNNTNNTYSHLLKYASQNFYHQVNSLLSPRLAYKNGPLSIELRAGWSNSRETRIAGDKGMFTRTYNRLSRIGFVADRPSPDSPEWTIVQTGGDPWNDPENFGRQDNYGGAVRSTVHRVETTQLSANLDAAYARRVFGHPVTFKAGAAVRTNDYDKEGRNDYFAYAGETGRQTEAVIPWSQHYDYRLDLKGHSGNLNQQNWRADNSAALYGIYQAHPAWFVADTVGNHTRALTTPRQLKERVDAAYAELNTRFGGLRLNAGLRGERTTTETKVVKMRSAEEVAAAGYDTATIEGVNFRYHNGARFSRASDYTNLFLSGGLKYDLAKNLTAQLSASQSILRPDYNNLAGVTTFNDTDRAIWIPNTFLKPERATKYYAGLQYYLNPAGLFSISAYRLDLADKQIRNINISRAQAEAMLGMPLADIVGNEEPDDPDNPGAGDSSIIYRTTLNAAAPLHINGLTLEYNQQLTFLPGALKGVSVFATFTRALLDGAQNDEERIGHVSKSASGGIRYRLGRFNLQVRGSWQGERLYAVTQPVAGNLWYLHGRVYQKARLNVDISGGFKISKNTDFSFSVRNALNAPNILYSEVSNRLYDYQVWGAVWNCAVKVAF